MQNQFKIWIFNIRTIVGLSAGLILGSLLFTFVLKGFAVTPFSIENIGGWTHQDTSGLGFNDRTKECTEVISTYTGERNTKLPLGWEKQFAGWTSTIQTDFGVCKYPAGYPAVCCRELGFTTVDVESPIVRARNLAVFGTSTQQVTVCDGELGKQDVYCKNRSPEQRQATIYNTCNYEPSTLVIDPVSKQCTLAYVAETVTVHTTVPKEEIDSRFPITGSSVRPVAENECALVQPVQGKQYVITEGKFGITRNGKFCDLSGAEKSLTSCCSELGYTLVETPSGGASGILKSVGLFVFGVSIVMLLVGTFRTLLSLLRTHDSMLRRSVFRHFVTLLLLTIVLVAAAWLWWLLSFQRYD